MGSLLMLALATAPVHVTAGTLSLDLYSSELAQWFHIVDQLSGRSPFNHAQYRRALGTDGGFPEEDEAVLREHAQLRRWLGYGTLEQATDSPHRQRSSWSVSGGRSRRASQGNPHMTSIARTSKWFSVSSSVSAVIDSRFNRKAPPTS